MQRLLIESSSLFRSIIASGLQFSLDEVLMQEGFIFRENFKMMMPQRDLSFMNARKHQLEVC